MPAATCVGNGRVRPRESLAVDLRARISILPGKVNGRTQLAPTDKTQALKQVFELINPQLYSVEERIRQQARAFDPAVEGYVAYAIESHGKRLRPALALLAGGATGAIGAAHFDLAVVVELIHAATLVHDDILDGADTRRGQPTANAKWGNSISVLLGDCLFAHALKLSTNFADGEVSRRIAQAASEVCSGEIIQTQRRFDLKLSVPDYYKIIEMKTAALFAAACELGAYLNAASPDTMKEPAGKVTSPCLNSFSAACTFRSFSR